MGSRFLALAAIALACIVAAGAGAYLAVRRGPASPQAPQFAVPSTDNRAPTGGKATPVGLVTTPPAASEVGDVGPAPAPTHPATEDRRAAADKSSTGGSSRRPANRTPTAAAPAERETASNGDQAGTKQNTSPATDVPLNGQAVPPTVAPVPSPAPEPQREFVDVTVPAESVLGLQVLTAVSSETAKVEDRVEARVTRDVRVNDRIAIPAGSQVEGSVVQVDRGGKVRDRAHFAIRFHTLVLPDGTRTPLTAEALHREGPSPANKSAARIGGAAVGGAILGAILGGGKGAAIGSGIGAAGGTAATMASDRQPATLAAGSMVNVRLMSPLVVTLER